MERIGKNTLSFTRPRIVASAASVGKAEGEGPLGALFDTVNPNDGVGCATWEHAEAALASQAVQKALSKAGLQASEADIAFAGDLLNQCVGSSFGLRDLNMPFAGLYGACSTMALAAALACVFVDRGAADRALACTSSHFASAERQFRYPLSYGGQRTPTSQWTVTGSGAAVIAHADDLPHADAVTIGKIVDMGVNDINNMGAAMAPAAADTLLTFFSDTGTKPEDYELILTGDLGFVGSELLTELMKREDVDISKQHNDCGKMIFEREKQDVHAGGSGCGCSASVLCSYILPVMKEKQYKNILFCATGALMSTVTDQQGGTIPSIAHLINIKA